MFLRIISSPLKRVRCLSVAIVISVFLLRHWSNGVRVSENGSILAFVTPNDANIYLNSSNLIHI
jgi:hypothetical protein